MAFGIASKRRSLRFITVKEEVYDERSEANMLHKRINMPMSQGRINEEARDAQSKIQMLEEGEVRQQHEEKKITEICIITDKKSEQQVLATITHLEVRMETGKKWNLRLRRARSTVGISWWVLRTNMCRRFVAVQRSDKKRGMKRGRSFGRRKR